MYQHTIFALFSLFNTFSFFLTRCIWFLACVQNVECFKCKLTMMPAATTTISICQIKSFFYEFVDLFMFTSSELIALYFLCGLSSWIVIFWAENLLEISWLIIIKVEKLDAQTETYFNKRRHTADWTWRFVSELNMLLLSTVSERKRWR